MEQIKKRIKEKKEKLQMENVYFKNKNNKDDKFWKVENEGYRKRETKKKNNRRNGTNEEMNKLLKKRKALIKINEEIKWNKKRGQLSKW